MVEEHNFKFEVQMNCGGCSGSVERVLRKLDGKHPPARSLPDLPSSWTASAMPAPAFVVASLSSFPVPSPLPCFTSFAYALFAAFPLPSHLPCHAIRSSPRGLPLLLEASRSALGLQNTIPTHHSNTPTPNAAPHHSSRPRHSPRTLFHPSLSPRSLDSSPIIVASFLTNAAELKLTQPPAGVKSYAVSLEMQTATVITRPELEYETVLQAIKEAGKTVRAAEADGEKMAV